MSRTVTATEINQQISKIMRDVSAGETITVTSRGKPILHMVPADSKKKPRDLSALWAYMDSHPPIVVGPWKREDLYDRE